MSPILTLTLNPAIDQTVVLDSLVPGSVHRARAVRSHAGGKGVNVACCLADWGLPVAAIGVLGSDNAAPFTQLMAEKGIADRFVRIPGETRTNLKLLDRRSGDTTDINLPGLAVPPDTLDAARAVLLDMAGSGSLAVLAGSLPGTLPPETYRDVAARLRGRGARVVLDASGGPLAAALATPADALPYAVKPNRHELEEWAGRALLTLGDVLAAARGLRDRGIAVVAVSLGPEGALFLSEGGAVHARPPATRITSTVGAGDALVAGLVAGLHEGLSLADTARRALAFAAAKLSREGASLPPRPEVEAIAATVRVEALG
ncbi:phosphofructokinase [Methylobacterium gregans]|uniref:Phosphofructokinase n=1 Tax=Methylobacterium gregans TaxID=374424 RepID=A0AA37HQH6_9HYPH|nr:1-phosphofructokinase [Methylobacterium gregans]MDQ0519586.1 1-phosphofructokinase [Methylobacterium gregans]GJD79716.1 ATP-dependent 6-phosphofructokinase isozyme 2 [Methylobacterium gregans]GLS52771.1 phosphofructokinase [Methylobacterium gregans]